MHNPTTDLFHTAFAHSSAGMAVLGLDCRWIEVNPALCRILGYAYDQLLARTIEDLSHPEDFARDMALLESLLAEEIPSYKLEKRYRHADGHVIWGLLTVSLSRDARGQPECLIAQVVDVTQQKTAEAERDAFFALSADLLAIAGTDGYLAQVNPAWTETLGWSADDLTARPFIAFVHPEDVAATQAEARRIYRGAWPGACATATAMPTAATAGSSGACTRPPTGGCTARCATSPDRSRTKRRCAARSARSAC